MFSSENQGISMLLEIEEHSQAQLNLSSVKQSGPQTNLPRFFDCYQPFNKYLLCMDPLLFTYFNLLYKSVIHFIVYKMKALGLDSYRNI